MTLGIDIGHENVKAVLMEDDLVTAKVVFRAAGGVSRTAWEAWERIRALLPGVGEDPPRTFVTGVGRDAIPWCQGRPTEMSCHLAGAKYWIESVRTVIDLGAEGIKVSKGDPSGRLMGFVLNDRCGAGTGIFLETVAEMLGISLEAFGEQQLMSIPPIPLTSTCAVFAESEIVGQIHRGVPREMIISGVLEAVAGRVASLVKAVGPERDVVATGGVSRNKALIHVLERHLGIPIMVPPEPQLMGALGAALLASGLEVTVNGS